VQINTSDNQVTIMESGHESATSPYVPDISVSTGSPPAKRPSWLAARLRQSVWLAWILPLVALGIWLGFEVSAVKPRNNEMHFFAMTTSIALWSLGSLHHIALIACSRQVPRSTRHLLPGLGLSAACVLSFLASTERTAEVINNYPVFRRGPPPSDIAP
jgi:hypothetical protein